MSGRDDELVRIVERAGTRTPGAPQRWDVIKAAKWGAALGVGYALYRAAGVVSLDVEGMARIAGNITGGVVAGAFMFSLVASIRNFWLRV